MAIHAVMSDMRTAVRDNLDESTAAFWTDARLQRCLSRAAHHVWQEVRKERADYGMVTRTSDDGTLTILGVSYAASSFAIVSGTTSYTLPPDLLDLRLIECITSGYEWVRFTYRPITDPEFIALRQITTAQGPGAHLFSIVGERTLLITPPINMALALRLSYIPSTVIQATAAGATKNEFSADSDELMLPYELGYAVEEVATWRAKLQDSDPGMQAWMAVAQESVRRWIGSDSRQSQDPTFVAGAFGI